MAIPLDELVNITVLTVAVTVGATALGSLLGIPLGVLLVLERFPGRGAIRTIVYALYAFPPIVAGVLLYLILVQAFFMAFLLRRLQRAERAFAHRIDTSHRRPKRPASQTTRAEG